MNAHVTPKPFVLAAAGLCVALAAFGCQPAQRPPRVDALPFDTPFQVDYPLFEGSVKQLVPERVGEFAITESTSAYAAPPGLEAWSAFFKSADGRQIHLRVRRYATPDIAYAEIARDREGAIVRAVQFEPAQSKGKIAGTLAKARYTNGVKGIEADTLWSTRGNVAFMIGSPDGVHAEEFWQALQATLEY